MQTASPAMTVPAFCRRPRVITNAIPTPQVPQLESVEGLDSRVTGMVIVDLATVDVLG